MPSLSLSFVDENFIRLADERREGKSGRSFDLAHFMRTLLTELENNRTTRASKAAARTVQSRPLDEA